MSIRLSRTTILALGFSLVSLAYSPAQTTLKMSTTTSTENSGLLKVLLPPFEKAERTNVHVIAVNPAKHPHVNYETARRFIEFVTGDEGQRIISSYRINGHQLFYPNAHKESTVRRGVLLNFLREAFCSALTMIISGDPEVFFIVLTSLKVSAAATAASAVTGIPLGMALAVNRFKGKRLLLLLLLYVIQEYKR